MGIQSFTGLFDPRMIRGTVDLQYCTDLQYYCINTDLQFCTDLRKFTYTVEYGYRILWYFCRHPGVENCENSLVLYP
eukprot:COSAG05_NODE_8495_length_696_cov_0.680000_1_plen_77_part_00